MFTGLIEEIGIIQSANPLGGGKRISIKANKIMDDLKIDDSVSINGVCQTVVSRTVKTFDVEAVEETIRKTTFGYLKSADLVNLERALRIGDRLGGHIVQGHVDCTGIIITIVKERAGVLIWISYPLEFSRYIVNSGSICINGISLTVAKAESGKFMSAIIPHTWELTILKQLKPGSVVNLEFDVMGKYIENMIKSGITNNNLSTNSSIYDQFIDQPF